MFHKLEIVTDVNTEFQGLNFHGVCKRKKVPDLAIFKITEENKWIMQLDCPSCTER